MENKHLIINVGRQLGSGGHDIARMLALDFNAKYYDKEILNLAARESGFSEKIFEQNVVPMSRASHKRTCLSFRVMRSVRQHKRVLVSL